jgi:hypothetical protein
MTASCDWVAALGADKRAMPIDATWAKPVLVTAAELLTLPDDEWCYELVEGRLLRVSPTGDRHYR